MPLTSTEKASAFRLKRHELGLVELRGVWVKKKHNTKEAKSKISLLIETMGE